MRRDTVPRADVYVDEAFWSAPIWMEGGPVLARAILAGHLGRVMDLDAGGGWDLAMDAFRLANLMIETGMWVGEWSEEELILHLIAGGYGNRNDEPSGDEGAPRGHLWLNPETLVHDAEVRALSENATAAVSLMICMCSALARARPTPFICPPGAEHIELQADRLYLAPEEVAAMLDQGARGGLFTRTPRPDGRIEWGLRNERRFWRHLGSI